MKQASHAIRERLAEACLELLGTPSVTGNEAQLASEVERWALSQRQLSRDDVIRCGNALIIGQPDSRRPCVALVGHLDTVPGHEDEAPPHRQNDRIVGLGASDMKGAIAVMQVFLETHNLEQLPFALVLVLYDREEGPYDGNGLQPLLERYEMLRGIDLAIAMEPTDNTLQLGCMGGIHGRFIFHGKAAHSARPWQGENAIHKAGPLLTHLLERPTKDVEVAGLIFREALSATLAKGGRARNTVPDQFELNLNYRFAPVAPIAATTQRAIRELQQLAGDAAEVRIVDVAPPGPVPTDNPILDHLQAHAQLPVEPKQAWTDVARLSAHGIDAVNFGPGAASQAHQKGEWVAHSALTRSFEVLSTVLSMPLEGY